MKATLLTDRRPIRALTRAALILAILALALPGTSAAQDPAGTQKKVLDHDAYDVWLSIDGERISADGTWVLYHLEPRVGDAELVVTRRGAREHRVARAVEARFTPDSRHAVFTIRPAHDSVRALKLAETEDDDLPPDTLGILDLATGEVVRVAGVRSWKVPEKAGAVVAYLLDVEDEPEDPEAGVVAEEPGEEPEEEPEEEPVEEPLGEPGIEPEPGVEPEPGEEPTAGAEGEDGAAEEREKPDSYPLVVRDLSADVEHRFDQVVAYELNDDGRRVGYTASSEDGTADGVYLVDVSTGERRTLLSGEGAYTGLVLDEVGEQVGFLTDRDDYHAEQPSFALFHWREGRDEARRVAWEGKSGIPAGWWVSEHGDLEFSENGERLYFGTRPRPAPEPEDSLLDDEKVRLDVWHWRDPYIQPMQLLNADEERRRTYLAVVEPGRQDRVLQLGTESLPDVEVGDEGNARWALAETNVPYRSLVGIESPGHADLWLIDLATGDRRRVVANSRAIGAHLSPGARYLAWYDAEARDWLALETGGAEVVSLTADVPYEIWDEEDDHPMLPYPYGAAGWTDGDAALLVYDRYDIWAVDPTGRAEPRRVTEGYGRERGVELRYIDLDPEEQSIDPTAPLLLSGFDMRSKESGFFRDRVAGTGAPERLIHGPKDFGRPTRARNADALLYTREDVAEFPDLWVADAWFRSPEKVSEANPQQSAYNWATVELVEWRSTDGIPLQGLLYKPEDFDPAETYPMMVYFYERNSDNLHSYHPPLPHRSVIRPTFYASRGYIVFVPDIVYEDGYPGESAMDAVMPGTLMLAAEPWVDADNVGVQGHSWGGYQIAYMVTRTDFFKAAEAGAPVANMTSAYGGIRWGSGLSRMFQYERTQSRLGHSLWEARDRYIENSPLFFLDRVKTPLLIMHNDQDGAVPWYQGIELFVGLRRLGKPAWMIVYNDEPHWPTTAAHIRDWNIRMQQFFDHFLKGEPAPAWLAEGVPATAKGRTLGLEVVEEPLEWSEPEGDR